MICLNVGLAHQILETAAELVDEVGVVGFTTNLLAERAGIRVRTIYRYFPSKLGVLNALMILLCRKSGRRTCCSAVGRTCIRIRKLREIRRTSDSARMKCPL